MKVAYIVIALIVILGAAFGTYILATGSQPDRRVPQALPAQAVSAEAVKDLKDRTESQFTHFERRIGDLEIIIRRLEKDTAALKSLPGSAPAKSSDEPLARKEDTPPEPLPEGVRRTLELRMKGAQGRMFEESQKRHTKFIQGWLERMAEKSGWDQQKKQSVMAIVAEYQQEVTRLLEAARNQGATGQEAYEDLLERIRQVDAWTMDKLRAFLTPEEMQQVERALESPGRMRFPQPRSGENAPVHPESVYMGVMLEDSAEGVKIGSVASDSPAEKAGLKEGDIIVGLDGQEIKSREEVFSVLLRKKPDDAVWVRIKRGSEYTELSLLLGKRR